MGKVIELILYPNRFWGIAEVFKDGRKIASINKFYDIDKDWIIIYETTGGQGIGYFKGNIITKIFIGDCELKTTMG